MSRRAVASFDRRALASQALQASVTARMRGQLDFQSPICIYSLCKTLGVSVRFNSINMEGMYQRGSPPRIHLSALRPLPRRAYNCAHELGHHIFGHGSVIDELKEGAGANSWEDPKEFLANTFAGFVLMPTLGMRAAFAARGWDPEATDPRGLYEVACQFGVGYSTLITHLTYGLNMISCARCATLQRTSPKAIRAMILGEPSAAPLVVALPNWTSPTLDVEVGSHLLLPRGTVASCDIVIPIRTLAEGRLFEAIKPGIVQATHGDWAVFVRVMRKEYVGLADYRHLEDDPDD